MSDAKVKLKGIALTAVTAAAVPKNLRLEILKFLIFLVLCKISS
jgi:hypothetical protein